MRLIQLRLQVDVPHLHAAVTPPLLAPKGYGTPVDIELWALDCEVCIHIIWCTCYIYHIYDMIWLMYWLYTTFSRGVTTHLDLLLHTARQLFQGLGCLKSFLRNPPVSCWTRRCPHASSPNKESLCTPSWPLTSSFNLRWPIYSESYIDILHILYRSYLHFILYKYVSLYTRY